MAKYSEEKQSMEDVRCILFIKEGTKIPKRPKMGNIFSTDPLLPQDHASAQPDQQIYRWELFSKLPCPSKAPTAQSMSALPVPSDSPNGMSTSKTRHVVCLKAENGHPVPESYLLQVRDWVEHGCRRRRALEKAGKMAGSTHEHRIKALGGNATN